MLDVKRIECGSPAFRHLTEAMQRANADICDIAFSFRNDQDGDRAVQIKVGGGTWTTPLKTTN